MLASGDPIGDVEAWPGAIERFMDEAKAHSWTPAVMGCSETGGEVWTRETGLDALELGDEAVVDVADFSLTGRAMRNVRQMVKRIERDGYETRVRRVRDLADGRAGADPPRRGGLARHRHRARLLHGPGPDRRPRRRRLRDRHRPQGRGRAGPVRRPEGVLHFVPWGADGMSLDLMRRDRSADPGMNELLIVAALQAAPTLGIERVSLNFAMFRSALARGEKLGAGPVLRAWRGLLVFLSRWFQIESLYKFNAKFRPRWEPRFVVFRNTRDLPRIGFAAMQAEGFVDLALPRPFLRRAQPARPRPCAHHRHAGANCEQPPSATMRRRHHAERPPAAAAARVRPLPGLGWTYEYVARTGHGRRACRSGTAVRSWESST